MRTGSLLAYAALPVVAAGVVLSAAAWGPAGEEEELAASALDNARVEASFSGADASGDGQLTRQETQSLPVVRARFDALDRDHDERLTLEEFAGAFKLPG